MARARGGGTGGKRYHRSDGGRREVSEAERERGKRERVRESSGLDDVR